MRISGQGVLLSLAASVLFVTLPGYVHLLEPLDSLQVVAHRVVWSIPMVFLLVVATRQWPTLRAAWRRLFAEPWLLACFPLTAAMMLLQWGIFIWAPLAGKTLELSLGYFLLPLAMVLVGRVFYGERLTSLQAIAVACALAGVLHEFWLTRAFSWVSLVTALGYPPYFMLRRRMGVDALSGFVFEMLFLLPLALAALYWLGDESQAFREAPRLWLLLPMLGLISALAFGAMMASSRLLPMGLFGILSYVEPVLLFLVAVLFLGEAFRPEQLWTYAPIWLSVGASWSMRSADKDYIGTRNGGHASSQTSDDGRLNFKKGETFSKIFKGIHDLELKYGDTGAFFRGKYWYDFELKDEHRLLYDIDDHNRKEGAKSSGAQLLDAFLYHNYSIGDLPGSVRVGKQVVSWGESTFIQNSINSINPMDVAAFRRPGAEIKEGLIPVNMLYLSQGISDALTVEGFYQLEWDQTVIDNCGTFFSTTDVVADGCERMVYAGSDFDPNPANGYRYLPRAGDRDARDSGQWGLALRWYAAELNDTEFGLYAMNYHSRNPYYSVIAGNGLATSDPVTGRSTGYYFIDYPEDIRLYGLSFQTNIGSTSVAGELSYRPNMPLQINSTDMSIAAIYPTTLFGNPIYDSGFATPRAGEVINGYVRKPVTQAQVTVTQFFDRVLAADRLTVVGEVGYNHLSGVDGDDLRYGRDAIYGIGELPNNALCTGALNVANPQECNSHGFYTRNSWGYRLRGILEYPNVFAGVNLKPNLAWSHDVEGYGPNFSEGAKAVSVGLDADYQNTYTASISYTDFFGGNYNPINDRDFLAVSFGVNF
ncbi:TPA: EamA family transporter RarD [Pseudomonas aeruginosa]|nr:EamA family transporter RarD [Pseudomonas aeruginosa]